jgi:hypothetical protein
VRVIIFLRSTLERMRCLRVCCRPLGSWDSDLESAHIIGSALTGVTRYNVNVPIFRPPSSALFE